MADAQQSDDLHTTPWEAWRGLLLSDSADDDAAEAAMSADLVYFDGETPWGEGSGTGALVPTPKGDRDLAKVRDLAAGLLEWESEVLARSIDGPSAWGAAVGAACEVLKSRVLMDNAFRPSPLGRAVDYVRKQGGAS